MKIRLMVVPALATALFGVIIILPACATTGRDRATKTTTSITAVESNYKEASHQIDSTNSSLLELIKPDQQNTKKAYSDYAANVNKTEKLAIQLHRHTEQMTLRRDAYFTEWEGEYTSPAIRELGERRRIELKAVYAQIPEASIGLRGDLASYVTDIREIEMYLSNDLTPQGIQAIRPIAQRAVKDGESVKEGIHRVLIAIDSVKNEMAQGGMKQ